MVKELNLSNNEVEKRVAEVKAALAMEELFLTDEETRILTRYAKGELTKVEAKRELGL